MIFRVLNDQNKPENSIEAVTKLGATEGIHSLTCRIQKSVNSIMQYLAWIVLGNFYLLFFLQMIYLLMFRYIWLFNIRLAY